MRLAIENLAHRFGGKGADAIVIDRLAIEPGMLAVVTGPSGSGKSTLLYLMSGLLVPAAHASARRPVVDALR